MKRNIYYFCTYFDSNYFVKGLTLYHSLVRHARPFYLWVLCLDDLTYETLQKMELPEVIPISLKDFEEGDQKLLKAKSNRAQIEYYFTCTSSFILFILRRHPEIDIIGYLDADLFFFNDLCPIYNELGNGSLLIVEHHFPPQHKYRELKGIYNVGLLLFRRDKIGLQCLDWWRSRCLEWCYDRVEDGRFADQKYLDDWPDRFPGVVVLKNEGAGLAQWNVENYSLCLKNGEVLVDSKPLVFFHFHGVKRLSRLIYDPNLARYRVKANFLLKRHIYGPYIRSLLKVAYWTSEYLTVNQPRLRMGSIRDRSPKLAIRDNIYRRMARRSINQLLVIKNVIQGNLWVVMKGRIL